MAPIVATKLLTLPHSKWRVLARRPSLITLVASGALPIELTSAVWKMASEGKEPDENSPQGLRQMAELMESFLPHVLVSPSVGPMTSMDEAESGGPLRGTLALIDLHDLDKRYLFYFGQGTISGDLAEREESREREDVALARFREGSGRADARSDGQALQSAPVGDDRAEPAQPASA